VTFPKGKVEHCIHIWLGGGAAQIDTWDPKALGDAKASKKKPGSYYKAIDTVVPEVKVCEHLGRCAGLMDRMTAVRTVNHDVIDEHAAAVNRMHTGRPVSGTTVYPSLGSVVAHEKGAVGENVPAYVVIGYPSSSRAPGFLGSEAGFLYLWETDSGPEGFKRPEDVSVKRHLRRAELLEKMRAEAAVQRGQAAVAEYDAAVQESLRLSGEKFMKVFDLQDEGDFLVGVDNIIGDCAEPRSARNTGNTPDTPGRIPHRVHRPLGLFRVLNVWHDQALNPDIQQPLYKDGVVGRRPRHR